MEKLMTIVLMGIICLNIILPPVMRLLGYKVNKQVSFCGLIGYCGSVPADPGLIKMLMVYNQDRGEDSTGWAINNEIVKDTEKVMKFITKYRLETSDDDENYTIIAHARKASSGARHKKDLAHPFGIRANENDNDSPYNLILAMNGTLTNTSLIAEKFHEDYKTIDNSDTQILSRIMSKLGDSDFKKVLELYDGTATLLFFHPSKPNTLIVYKDPERPLHCWNKSDNELYISSLPESLEAIGAPSKDLKYFDGDKLYYIKDGLITSDEKVVRTPLKPVVDFRKQSYSHGRNFQHYNSDYEDLYNSTPKSVAYSSNIKTKNSNLRERGTSTEFHKNRGSRVYTVNEKYYRNGHPLNELNYITDGGKLKSYIEAQKDKSAKPYYFINGYLCRSKESYDRIFNRCKDKTERFDIKAFQGIKISEFVDDFEYPVLTTCDEKEVWLLNKHYQDTVKVTGEMLSFTPFLSDEKFQLIRTSRWTNPNRKIICEVGEVKKIGEPMTEADKIEQVMSPEYEKKNLKFFTSKLLNSEFNNPHFYFASIKKDLWKLNNSETLKEYFFTLILKLAKFKEILDERKFNELIDAGKSNMFSGVTFGTDLEKIIDLIRKTIRLEDSVIDADNDSSLTSFQKIKVNHENNSISEYDMVKSIMETNTFCTTRGFEESIHYSELLTFEEFISEWVPGQSSERDIYDLCEAVLVVLSISGRIDEGEVLYALDANGVDLKNKAKETYENWVAYLTDVDNNKPDIESPGENLEKMKEEMLSEVKGPKYYEEEFQSEAIESMNSIKDLLSRMDKVAEGDKNENFHELRTNLNKSLDFMETNILNK
jgi:hypothetical protein